MEVFLTYYKGKIAPNPVQDPTTKKLIEGHLIHKTNAGPGRLACAAKIMEFCNEMAALGMTILLSLPDGTEYTAELDQIYRDYKPECKKSTIHVAGIKIAARVALLGRKPSWPKQMLLELCVLLDLVHRHTHKN